MRMAPGGAAAAAASRSTSSSSANSSSANSTSKPTTTANTTAISSKSSQVNLSPKDRAEAIARKVIEAIQSQNLELPSTHTHLLDVVADERWQVLLSFWNSIVETTRLRQSTRYTLGQVTAHWLTSKTITIDDFRRALGAFLADLEDVEIDIPKVQVYLVQMLGEFRE